MKKLLFLVLFVATAMLGQAQVSKMIGQWNTYDDNTGDLRSTVKIYEENGTYEAVIITLYEKDANGKFQVMKAPYPKGFEGTVDDSTFASTGHGGRVRRPPSAPPGGGPPPRP